MENQNKELHNNDRKLLAEHFAGKTFNDKLVAEFCTNSKIALTDAGSVEDFIYQAEYDRRMGIVIPKILAVIATFKYANEYDTEQERKDISNFNDDISKDIAQIIEDNGMEYREIGFLQGISGDISQTFQNAERRLSNMCAVVLAEIAMEKLGKLLTVKSLAEERVKIADRKAKKIEAVKEDKV